MKWFPHCKSKRCRLSDSQPVLVEQAKNCVQLVDDGELDEALAVLRVLSNTLIQSTSNCNSSSQIEAFEAQQILNQLALALAGATKHREDSRGKLLNLRTEQQVKAVYSASSLPH